MIRRTGLNGLAGIVLVTALASCGDDDRGSDSGDADSAKAAYVQRANALCADVKTRTDELADRLLGGREEPPPAAVGRAYERKAMRLQRRALAELRALPPPPGDEQRVAAIYDAMEAAIESLSALPAGEPGAGSDAALTRFADLAAAYGLTECAGS